LSSSDVILFKLFKLSIMALAPSFEILLLDKKFYIFIYRWNILVVLKSKTFVDLVKVMSDYLNFLILKQWLKILLMKFDCLIKNFIFLFIVEI